MGRARRAQRRLGAGRRGRRGGGQGGARDARRGQGATSSPIYDADPPDRRPRSRSSRARSMAPTAWTSSPAAQKAIGPARGDGSGPDPGLHRQDPVLLQRRSDPKLGRPKGFRITIRDVYPSAGAGFVVALAGDIMTMPGSGQDPRSRGDPGAGRRDHRGTVLGARHAHHDGAHRPRAEGHRPVQPGRHPRRPGLTLRARSRSTRPPWRSCPAGSRSRPSRSWPTSRPSSRRPGSDLARVLKTTVFLADMADFAAMNEVYARAFGDHRPARSTVAAAGLPRNVRVEIEVVAVKR